MNSFPELTTPRLRLRKIQLSDIPSLIKNVNHPAIFDNILNFPSPYREEDAIARINFVLQGFKDQARYVFAIASLDNDEFMGEIGLHLDKDNNRAEMGFWIGEPFWNKGLMTEAAKEALKYGFEVLKLNKILATHFVENEASGKVLVNIGMIKEAELKDHYKHRDHYRSVNQYRLTADEYEGISNTDSQ